MSDQHRQPTVVHALAAAAKECPDRVALRLLASKGDPTNLTFSDLWRDARRFGAHLRSLGVSDGAHVILMLPPGRDFVAAFFGIHLAGGTPTPVAPPFRLDALDSYLANLAPVIESCDPLLFVTTPEMAQAVESTSVGRCASPPDYEQPHELEDSLELPLREATAVLQYTSGATSRPRGIRLSHGAVVGNIEAIGSSLKLTEEDVAVSWLPMFADMGLIGMLLTGIYWRFEHCAMTPESFLIRPVRWLDAITTHRATLSCAPNFAYRLATRRIRDRQMGTLDLSSWRVALIGAEAIDPTTPVEFEERFAGTGLRSDVFVATYGLAENSLAVTIGTPGAGIGSQVIDGVTVASSGRPMVGQQLRIFSPQAGPVADGEVGEVCVRSPTMMDGYHGAEAATALTVRDGWLHSGDLGTIIDGDLYITGRLKPMIIKRGRNYYPVDIERIAAKSASLPFDDVVAFAADNQAAGTEDVVLVAEHPAAGDDVATRELDKTINVALLQNLGIRADRLVLAAPGDLARDPDGAIAREECHRWFADSEVAA